MMAAHHRRSMKSLLVLSMMVGAAGAEATPGEIATPAGWTGKTSGDSQLFTRQFADGEMNLAVYPWIYLDGTSAKDWLSQRKTDPSGRSPVIGKTPKVGKGTVKDTYTVNRQLRPIAGKKRASLLFACEKSGHIRYVDLYGPVEYFAGKYGGGAMGKVVSVACGSNPPVHTNQAQQIERASKRPDFKEGTPPDDLEDIWYVGYFVPGVNGYEARQTALMTFDDDSASKDFDGVFGQSVKASRRSNPKDWGTWDIDGNDLKVKWAGKKGYRDYFVSLRAEPGRDDHRMDGCYSSSKGYTLPSFGGAYTASFAVNAWCFAKNGRFSNDTSVAISSGGSGSASSAGHSSSDKTGWYRIDGYVVQFIYDNGREVTTSFAMVDHEKSDDGILIGGSYFD